jgi:hypothetical protein
LTPRGCFRAFRSSVRFLHNPPFFATQHQPAAVPF